MMAASVLVSALVRLSLLNFGLGRTDPQVMVAKLRKAKDGASVLIFPRLRNTICLRSFIIPSLSASLGSGKLA